MIVRHVYSIEDDDYDDGDDDCDDENYKYT